MSHEFGWRQKRVSEDTESSSIGGPPQLSTATLPVSSGKRVSSDGGGTIGSHSPALDDFDHPHFPAVFGGTFNQARNHDGASVHSVAETVAGGATRAATMMQARNSEEQTAIEWEILTKKRFNIPIETVFPESLQKKLEVVYLQTKGGKKAIFERLDSMQTEIRFTAFASPDVQSILESIESAVHVDALVEKLQLLAQQQVKGKIGWEMIDAKMTQMCGKASSGNVSQDVKRSVTLWRGIAATIREAIRHNNLTAEETGELWIKWFTQAIGPYLRSKTSIEEVVQFLTSNEADLDGLYFETAAEVADREGKKSAKKRKVEEPEQDCTQEVHPRYISGNNMNPPAPTPALKEDAEAATKMPRTYVEFMISKIEEVKSSTNPLARFHTMKNSASTRDDKYKWAIEPILAVLQPCASALQDEKFCKKIVASWDTVLRDIEEGDENLLSFRIEMAKKIRLEREAKEKEEKIRQKEEVQKAVAAARSKSLRLLSLSNNSQEAGLPSLSQGKFDDRSKPNEGADGDSPVHPTPRSAEENGGKSNLENLKARFQNKFRKAKTTSDDGSCSVVTSGASKKRAAKVDDEPKRPATIDYEKTEVSLRKHLNALLHPLIEKKLTLEKLTSVGILVSESLAQDGHQTRDFDRLLLALKDVSFGFPPELALYALRCVILEGIKTLSKVIMTEMSITDFEYGLRRMPKEVSDLSPLLTVRGGEEDIIDPMVFHVNFDVLVAESMARSEQRELKEQEKMERHQKRRELKVRKMEEEREEKRKLKQEMKEKERRAKENVASQPDATVAFGAASSVKIIKKGAVDTTLTELLEKTAKNKEEKDRKSKKLNEVKKEENGSAMSMQHSKETAKKKSKETLLPFQGLDDDVLSNSDDEIDVNNILVTDSEEEAEAKLTPHQKIFGAPGDKKYTATLISISDTVTAGRGCDMIEAAWKALTAHKQDSGKKKAQKIKEEPLPLSVQKLKTCCLCAACIVALASHELPRQPDPTKYRVPTAFMQFQERFLNGIESLENICCQSPLLDTVQLEITRYVAQLEKIQGLVLQHLIPDLAEVLEYIEWQFKDFGRTQFEDCRELYQHYVRQWGHLRPLRDGMFNSLEKQLKQCEAAARHREFLRAQAEGDVHSDSDVSV